MKRFLILFFSILLSAITKASPSYFNAGVQYGVGISTIYKFTDTYGYFESLNYGKKPFLDIGFFVNRDITRNLSIESGIFYNAKGIHYRFYYNTMGIYSRLIEYSGGIYNEGVYLNYIEIPFIVNILKRNRRNVFWRYGINLGVLFDTNMSNFIKSTTQVFNDFDMQGILGLKLCPDKNNFFRNKSIVINLKCSILPIVKAGEEYHYDPEKNYNHLTNKIINVLPIQRNISLSVSIQHLFNH